MLSAVCLVMSVGLIAECRVRGPDELFTLCSTSLLPFTIDLLQVHVNPSDSEATFIQSTRTQIFENNLNHIVLVFIG